MGRHDVVYAYSGTLLINKKNKLLTHASTYEPENIILGEKGGGGNRLGFGDWYVHATICKIVNQQRPTV